MENLTLEEQLAFAVIKGDIAAQYALVDLINEKRNTTHETLEQKAVEIRKNGKHIGGYTVYGWPEFKAFVQRLGIIWNHLTIDLHIHITERSVTYEQSFGARDTKTEVGGVDERGAG